MAEVFMKYVLFSIFSFWVVLPVVTGCAVTGSRKSPERTQVEQIPQKQTSTDKIYEGSASGYRGLIHVRVRMSGGSISEITVVDSEEDRFVGGAAMEELIETVTELNSVDVDAVSGATITSEGFLEAVKNAIIGL
jgi:uncharacterized protein with FMN-binding domain